MNRPLSSGLLGSLFIGAVAGNASTDYGPAVWRPACSGKWYSSGNGHKFAVIHDMEGYYLSSIAYLNQCGVSASIHYAVNGKQDASSDAPAGEVSQCVREAYYAWHAGCWNTYSFGTEHEGFASNPAWFTSSPIVLQRHCRNICATISRSQKIVTMLSVTTQKQ